MPRYRSQGFPPERERHTAGPAATSRQLAAFNGDHGTVLGLRPVIEGEKISGRNDAESRGHQSTQGLLVAPVAHQCPWTDRQEITGRAPLFPFLIDASLTAGKHRLQGQIHLPKGGEEVRLLHDSVGPLSPVDHREPLWSDEIRWVDHAQFMIDLIENHIEVN